MSITPPNTSKIQSGEYSTCSSSEITNSKAEHKVEIFKEYIKESSILITSLWLNPTRQPNSLFSNQRSLIKSTEYECFLREVLKRSRCSLHILQLAMYYLFKLQKQIKNRFVEQNLKNFNCPKKVFLTCLILSFKFSYDSSYKFKTWAKISGLTVQELQSLEMVILKSLDYELNISKQDYTIWVNFLDGCLSKIGESYRACVSPKRPNDDTYEQLRSSKRVRAV